MVLKLFTLISIYRLDAVVGAAAGASGRVIQILRPPTDPCRYKRLRVFFDGGRRPQVRHAATGWAVQGDAGPAPGDPETPVWEILATCGEYRGDITVNDAESLAAVEAVKAILAYVAGGRLD